MSNVVTFGGNKPPEPPEDEDDGSLMLTCGKCQCASFRLYTPGIIECANCQTVIKDDDEHTSEWRRCIPEAPAEDTISDLKSADGAVAVISMGTVQAAVNRSFRKIKQWVGDGKIGLLIGYHVDGEGSHWLGANNASERDWIVRQLKQTIHNMEATVYPDEAQPEFDLTGALGGDDGSHKS